MRKTDKKRDNQIRLLLTDVCESALKDFVGFQWLTHLVDYANFPQSLRVICVFDSNHNLSRFMASGRDQLDDLIQKKLFEIDININRVGDHISYDTEENSDRDGSGNWANRLANHEQKSPRGHH